MSTSCCPFHNNRTSAICCFAAEKLRNTKGTRNKNTTRASGTQIGVGTKSSKHDPQDLLPGVDFSSSVITEVDCGPLRLPEKGIISKTKEVVGRLSRIASNPNTGSGQMMSQHGDDIEMYHVGTGNEIVVSYDVWRTIEEKSEDSIETK
jgi:hypothetical protein